MKARIVLLLLLSVFTLSSCNKKANTKDKQEAFLSYNVRIANKIKEPTIIAGFYGKVMKYEGNFQPQTSGEAKEPEVSQTPILVFLPEHKEQIESIKYEENGVTFYNLKALKDRNILPKYRITPNKYGFYQIDLGTGQFHVLLEIKGKRGYYNGGLGTLTSSESDLMELEMRVDYKASF